MLFHLDKNPFLSKTQNILNCFDRKVVLKEVGYQPSQRLLSDERFSFLPSCHQRLTCQKSIIHVHTPAWHSPQCGHRAQTEPITLSRWALIRLLPSGLTTATSTEKKSRGAWRAERRAGGGAGALQLNVHSGDDTPPGWGEPGAGVVWWCVIWERIAFWLRPSALLKYSIMQRSGNFCHFLSQSFPVFQCFSVLKPCLKALWKTTNLLFIQTWILSVCIIGFLKSQCLIVCPSGRTERVNPESQTLQPNHQAFGAEVHPLPSSGWVQKAQPNTSRHGQGLIKPSPLLKRSLHWIN